MNGLTKGATDTVGGLAKNTLGGVTGGGAEQKEEGGGDDTLKVREDAALQVCSARPPRSLTMYTPPTAASGPQPRRVGRTQGQGAR